MRPGQVLWQLGRHACQHKHPSGVVKALLCRPLLCEDDLLAISGLATATDPEKRTLVGPSLLHLHFTNLNMAPSSGELEPDELSLLAAAVDNVRPHLSACRSCQGPVNWEAAHSLWPLVCRKECLLSDSHLRSSQTC